MKQFLLTLIFPFMWCRYRILRYFRMREIGKLERLAEKGIKAVKNQKRSRDELVEELKHRLREFNEKGGRSEYIPRKVRTRSEMREHLLFYYGDDMKRHGLGLTPSLKFYSF